MTRTDLLHPHKPIALWLFGCCLMVMLVVWIGGITRLTESGLSIVEWKPVAGILPPMGEVAWQEEFIKYQKSPEYQKVNHGMSLPEFKKIFALEYAHRLIARLIGVVFLLPFLYFAFRKQLSKSLLMKFSAIFLLGGVQGAIGWLMVKSGLQHDPSVSQYRLALHLGTGFLIYGLLLWNALTLWGTGEKMQTPVAGHVITVNRVLLGVIFLQVLSGALVAKLHAGLIYNSFPLMDGRWIPQGMWILQPWFKNLCENVTTVQFFHRTMAGIVLILTVSVFAAVQRLGNNKSIKMAVNLVMLMVLVQISLGIATLLAAVPIALASLHQVGALLLFSLALNSLHTMLYKRQ
jgi:cytochrome c oxidase assembly protein subunit 15